MAKVLVLTSDQEVIPIVEEVLRGLGLKWRVAHTAFEAACLVVEGKAQGSPFKIFLIDEYLCEFDNSYEPGSQFAKSGFVHGAKVISLTRSFSCYYEAPKEDLRFAKTLERVLRIAVSRVD